MDIWPDSEREHVFPIRIHLIFFLISDIFIHVGILSTEPAILNYGYISPVYIIIFQSYYGRFIGRYISKKNCVEIVLLNIKKTQITKIKLSNFINIISYL